MLKPFVCEVCDAEATLTDDDAYSAGWDYPPFMGEFGVVSARTCGNCGIEQTLWYAMTVDKIPTSQLHPRHLATLRRILSEA